MQVFTYILNYDLAVVKHEFYFVNHTIHAMFYNVNHFFHCAQTIHVISYFVNSLMNTYLKDCLRCPDFSKVSSILGRDAFGILYTLLYS